MAVMNFMNGFHTSSMEETTFTLFHIEINLRYSPILSFTDQFFGSAGERARCDAIISHLMKQ